jgi:hypothetical protein
MEQMQGHIKVQERKDLDKYIAAWNESGRSVCAPFLLGISQIHPPPSQLLDSSRAPLPTVTDEDDREPTRNF